MPTVARHGLFRFVVNTRENDFEPPHVHVWVGNEDVCRNELTVDSSWMNLRLANSGAFSMLMTVTLR